MLRTTILAAATAAIALSSVAGSANAGITDRGLTTIWVTVEALPGEGLWEACRRVYQHDVYKVRGGSDFGLVRCEIDHSRLNY